MFKFAIVIMVAACGSVSSQPDMNRDAAADTSSGSSDDPCAVCATQVQHGTAVCTTAKTCDYTTCAAGFGDFDADRANGCESTLPTGVPEANNLVLWLAGDVGWNGTTWTDRSGGARHANTYYGAPGSGTQNGRTVVDFNGGELLINTGFPNWAGVSILTVANTSQEDSLISMGVSYNPNCTTTPPNGAPNCVAYDQLAFNGSMTLQQCDPAVGTCWQAWGPTVPLNTWVRSVGIQNPAANPSYRSYFNGVENAGLNNNLNYPYPAPWSTPRKDTIVGWRNYRGKIAELIIFNVALSDASRIAIDKYLATKWNVQ